MYHRESNGTELSSPEREVQHVWSTNQDGLKDAKSPVADRIFQDGQLNMVAMEETQKLPVTNGVTVSDVDPAHTETTIVEGESVEDETEAPLIYKISDRPPVHLIAFFGFQQAVLSIAHQLAISLLVAEVVCATNDNEFKAKLLSTTLFMTGLTTLLMVTVGVRLPLFQGAAVEYLAPLLALGTVDTTFCTTEARFGSSASEAAVNVTANMTDGIDSREQILNAVTSLQGSLMVAGGIHTLIGITGIVGVLLRFIGPITIVPTVFLIALYMIKAATKFVLVHWGISMLTASVTLILSLYLGRKKTPFPIWTPRRGFRIFWYPFHQVFAILIGIIVGWVTCALFTAYDVIPNDPEGIHYHTRTDSRSDVIETASWFNVPYPGQFGAIQFSSSALVGCMLATILSILDSVGDYYACSKACHVPPPPRHAVNRGLSIEGLCTFISGTMGCGHATTTYAGNIGAMGLTKVGSRWVFVAVGIIYMLFGVIGKFSAVFITIPYPVMGGALIAIVGVFIGVVLSNLNEISLTSKRNLAIMGVSLMMGIMVPYWIEKYPDEVMTENMTLNNFLKMFLGNANFAGAVCAFFLDNTVPGTKEERGILAWHNPKLLADADDTDYLETDAVYIPWLPVSWRSAKILRYIPFMPGPEDKYEEEQVSDSYTMTHNGELL